MPLAIKHFGLGLLAGLWLATAWFVLDRFVFDKTYEPRLYVATVLACAVGFFWGRHKWSA